MRDDVPAADSGARPDLGQVFRRYGIEPNRRSAGGLDLWLRCQVRRWRLIRRELTARPPLPWSKRLAAWRRGFMSASVVLYRLERGDASSYVDDWTYSLASYRYNGFFNPVVGNKLVLSQILAAHGVSHPRVHGVVRRGRPVAIGTAAGDAPRDPMRRLDDWAADGRPLVFRPYWSGAGEGVFFVRRDDGAWTLNWQPVADADLRALVASLDRYIVTAYVDQAAYAAAIYPHTANTIRVLTMIDDDGPFVAAIAHRFGTRRSGVLDNFHQGHGGLSAPVDRVSGRIGTALTLDADGTVREHARHPDTGAPIEGATLVGLARALDGVLDAARCLPEAPLVGWDVLVTDDGYSILEGNSPPALQVWQVHGPLLRDRRVARFFATGAASR